MPPKISKQIETIDPKSEVVRIPDRMPVPDGACAEADREYTQRELSLRQTGILLEFLTTILIDPEKGLDLDEVLNLDLNTGSGLATLLNKIVALGPTVVARLVAILLNAPQDDNWLADNMTPVEALSILRRGIRQNDLPRLLADFFDLQAELEQVLSQARADKKQA